ncbi:polyphosphate--glucose phosphotransferase [Brachybacterium sp. FME24]|uniref:polyphosphate--glucose phosphotransferase n=1 Tax=Brachybacterium sp. FME24 TaxID=2742605 RepID=UPI0018670168
MSKAKTPIAFGIDIGGSGIKGAPVDLTTGQLTAERVRIRTPQPSTPDAVADAVRDLVASFDIPRGTPVGVTFPAVIQHGVAKTAANVDSSWIGTDVDALLTERTGHDVFVVNDADAAGIAEMDFGAGQGRKGVVLVITLGTGVGSGMFVDGKLVPNAELGHLPLKGDSAEKYMASSVREREELSWKKWSKRLQKYFSLVEFLFSPDLIIVGGGISKEHEKFLPRLDLHTPIVPAGLRNEAGIVGAAALAQRATAPSGDASSTPAPKPDAKKAPATKKPASKTSSGGATASASTARTKTTSAAAGTSAKKSAPAKKAAPSTRAASTTTSASASTTTSPSATKSAPTTKSASAKKPASTSKPGSAKKPAAAAKKTASTTSKASKN